MLNSIGCRRPADAFLTYRRACAGVVARTAFNPGVATPMIGFRRSASEKRPLQLARAGARLGPSVMAPLRGLSDSSIFFLPDDRNRACASISRTRQVNERARALQILPRHRDVGVEQILDVCPHGTDSSLVRSISRSANTLSV